jgi:biopolymer transport protein TolQ
MFEILAAMSPVILFVLGLLIFFSIVSWTILVLKMIQIATVQKSTKAFLDFFWDTKEFPAIQAGLDRFPGCPAAVLFREGYRETQHFLLENVTRNLRKTSTQEIDKLEKNISFLATTASTTPFIGLFGTVWGIMNAFQNIGAAGSTSLAIVAPGISEALVTTAIGLAVAIPAVIGYNYLQSQIRRLINEIDNFAYDFLNLVQKIFNTQK